MEQFNKAFTTKKTITKEQFLRRVYIELTKSKETPAEFYGAKFGEVKESKKQIVCYSAKVDIDYSVSVGYDRKEQYQTTEKKSLSQGDWYTCNGVQRRAEYNGTYSVDCIKERTVTDWSPLSGKHSSEEGVLVYNDQKKVGQLQDEYDIEAYDRVYHFFQSIKEEDWEEIEMEGRELSHVALKTAKNYCTSFSQNEIEYPGDRIKDERIHAIVEPTEIICYEVPFYEVSFQYQGKTYHANGFACGKSQVETEYIPCEIDIEKIAAKKVMPLKVFSIIGWIGAAVTGLLFFVTLAGVLNTSNMWLYALIAAGVGIVFSVVKNKRKDGIVNNFFAERKAVNVERLKSLFKEKKYAALTNQELKEINEASKDYGWVDQLKKKNLQSVKKQGE